MVGTYSFTVIGFHCAAMLIFAGMNGWVGSTVLFGRMCIRSLSCWLIHLRVQGNIRFAVHLFEAFPEIPCQGMHLHCIDVPLPPLGQTWLPWFKEGNPISKP